MLEIGQEWTLYTTPFKLKKTTAPSAAEVPTDTLALYAKDKSGTSALYLKDDAGNEREVGPANVVTGTGTANRLAYWSSTSVLAAVGALTQGRVMFPDSNGLPTGDSKLFWDNTSKLLGLGGTPSFQFHGIAPDASSFNFTLETYGTGAVPNYRARAARGTAASPSSMQADDLVLAISALPYAGSAFATGARAQINFLAAEALSGTNQGTYMVFKTTPTGGSTTIAERFRVGPAGQWGIGGATFGSNGDIFSSGGASAAPTWVTRATLNAALDHGTLTGLGDDDHTIYALLAGRSGGQTLIGGTASGNTLTFKGTSNATPGIIGSVTVGTLNPTWVIDHYADTPRMRFRFANGTVASPTATVLNDGLGSFQFAGYNGAAFTASRAFAAAFAAENWDGTSNGAYLSFATTAKGSTSVTTQVKIPEDGGIALTDGITAPATEAGFAKIYVDSADGDLKVKFGDGFVKVIAADS